MLLTCVLVIKTTRQAAVSAAWIHRALYPPPAPPLPRQSGLSSPFSPGLFQSTDPFQGGKKNDLLWMCTAGILKMLIWVNVCT